MYSSCGVLICNYTGFLSPWAALENFGIMELIRSAAGSLPAHTPGCCVLYRCIKPPPSGEGFVLITAAASAGSLQAQYACHLSSLKVHKTPT